ncbi:hypothetical protein LCGC14_1059330 [marine sediment metagenome]|uniref:BAH domain-containing protein n=1 Tax=marine sediment metagenome TaxID=412755 RepID=A0A0F9N8I0_9ZZZZ
MKNMEILFWKVIVEIIQIPNDLNEIFNNGTSWLSNPFGDHRVYGTKFSIGADGFSWKFYMNINTEEGARRMGYGLLSYLKELYSGLDGTVKVKQIGSIHLKKEKPYLSELILPSPPYINNQIPLIQKIMNLAESNNSHEIRVYIFWQFKDHEATSVLRDNTKSIFRYDFYYKIRIFIEVRPLFRQDIKRDEQVAELLGYLDYLITDIKNMKGNCAVLKKADVSAKHLLTMENLFNKSISIDTSIYDSDTKSFSKKIKAIDFSIPPNMPLDKAYTVHNENLGVPVTPPKILLGNAYRQGVLTKTKMYLHLHDLIHHVFISGLSGVGKSRFIASLANQIKNQGAHVGILVINLVKKGEEGLYNPDIILRKRDLEFRVPYFIPDKDIEVICKQVAAYLVSSLGLKNVVLSITKNVLYDDCIKIGFPKQHPEEVFMGVIEWLKMNPYHPKFNTNITRAIENRVISLLSSPFIKNILKLGPVPNWFIEWKKGKNVYIDLSNFTEDGKRIITHAIFQMVRTLLPELRTNELKYVIILDEAHEILEKTKHQSIDDDETVTRHYLEIVFEKVLRAFRSRGVCLVLADHLPNNLFEGVYKLPSIKVIFRSDKDFLQYISNFPEEQDDLANQKNRRALILDGVNARKFAIHTIDYSYQEQINESGSSGEMYCSNCKELLEMSTKFCHKCGTII